MLAVLALYLNVETKPIDLDRAMAQYAVARAFISRGDLSYYNHLEGYYVENGNVRRIIPIPMPEHAKRMSDIDNGKRSPDTH